MIKNSISQLFFNEGCLLDGEKKLLYDCDRDIVLKYFEYYGVIIFRNFRHEVKNIINFTDIFTKLYANSSNDDFFSSFPSKMTIRRRRRWCVSEFFFIVCDENRPCVYTKYI